MGRMKQSQITYWCHEIIRSQAEEGGYYIDATMGKGNDTLFLCELAGEKGKVLAFDIQQEALDVTKELLKTHGKEMQAELILDGHEHIGPVCRKRECRRDLFLISDIFREAIIILQPHTGPVLRQSEKALAY